MAMLTQSAVLGLVKLCMVVSKDSVGLALKKSLQVWKHMHTFCINLLIEKVESRHVRGKDAKQPDLVTQADFLCRSSSCRPC